MDKPVTVRLRDSQVRELMALAVMDDVSLADLLRTAVTDYVNQRLSDPDLVSKAEAAKERQNKVFEELVRPLADASTRPEAP
ncbi:MAG: hypothetical protein IPL94_00110 [Tetrasphaera sp.]|nr:hypothetical protein [Tetrasphaera sp.]